MTTCNHPSVQCLNEYEYVRKYRCDTCEGVMMCACDEPIGRRFLPHQLREGTELTTQSRVPVTHDFQPSVCRQCRGLTPEAHPMGSIPGRTSKIKRFYWRELAFLEWQRIAELSESGTTSEESISPESRQKIATDVLDEIKLLHTNSPKYSFKEESQSEAIKNSGVEVMDLKAVYAKERDGKKALVLHLGEPCFVEDFARRHFATQNYQTVVLESRPFHALFAVFCWLLIQDPFDPLCRIVSFGRRSALDEKNLRPEIHTYLPEDFGTPGYGKRRVKAINKHFSKEMNEAETLHWLFDYWLDHSKDLREYLWAHKEADVATARQLLEILPAAVIVKILRYLVDDYWGRYLGWPDLLVYNGTEYFLVEVKGSGDKLSDEQKRWIRDNASTLKLPFKLMKIHRA